MKEMEDNTDGKIYYFLRVEELIIKMIVLPTIVDCRQSTIQCNPYQNTTRAS